MAWFRFVRTGLLATALILAAAAAWAEDYTIGPEDVLQISVYLHPELERQAVVNTDGNVTFPPIGEIKASGLTPKALGDRIADKLSTYLRQTTAVTVTVSRYLSRSVYVSGAVASPARYGFERIPSIVDVIGQAGGASPTADLSRVEIIRREGDSRRSLFVDVTAAMRDPQAVMPELKPGDTIVVPGTTVGGSGTAGAGVGVLGEVSKPGVYPVGPGQDLWSVLAAAGGVAKGGSLSDVRVISSSGGRQAVVTVNLRQVLERGGRAPYIVRSGDIVVVPTSGGANFARAWGGLQGLLAVGTQVLNLAVAQKLLTQ